MKVFSVLFSVLILTLLISVSSARNVKFSIVSFGKTVKVKIGSKKYALTKVNNYTPLFQTTVTVNNGAISYKYIVDGISEDFTRTLAKGEKTTHNEFFGRKDTVKQLPQFKSLGTWTRSIGKGELFDDSYIPTVHIGGTKGLNFFKAKSPKVTVLDNIVFILKDNVYTFKNAQISGKNFSWNKFQFKVLLGNNGIDGRYVLKFRDNNEDPTFMRQDLYGDMLSALGYPIIQSVKARVYVEGNPVGYYIIQEEAPSTSYVRSAFHGDNNGNLLIKKTKKLGYPVDAGTGADFYYTGNKFSSFLIKDTGHGDTSRVAKLAKAFEELNAKNNNAVKQFEQNWFDIDTFLKAIVMQYLTASYDSYWFFSSNFALYDDPTQSKNGNYKFYFICQDWDGTFGINTSKEHLRFDNYIEHSYKDYVNVKWGNIGDSPYRYAIDKLFQNASVRTRFETILKDTVKYIFNPVAVSKRLDALVERHKDEIKWNYDVIRNTPLRKGKAGVKFTYDDFLTSIDEAIEGAPFGLKQFIYLRAKAVSNEFGLKVNLGNVVYEMTTTGKCGKGLGKCIKGYCCSAYGYCGKTADHCGIGCQSEFGQCDAVVSNKQNNTNSNKDTKTNDNNISTNGLCGKNYGKCPNGECCSKFGYCGSDDGYCKTGCQKAFGVCK